MAKKKKRGTNTPPREPYVPLIGQPKLSDRIKALALPLLIDPDAPHSFEALSASCAIASAGWNSANGDDTMRNDLEARMREIDWGEGDPWGEFEEANFSTLFDEIAARKRALYPEDRRLVLITRLEPNDADGLKVTWIDPEAARRAEEAEEAERKRKRRQPIADKLLKKMGKLTRARVIDFQAFRAGKEAAEAFQKTAASFEDLAGLSPAHRLYAYAQNQASVMTEQLTALKELGRHADIIESVEEEFGVGGPPISPLTTSFFSNWAIFDLSVGLGRESLGTLIQAIGGAHGMDPELVRLIGLLERSRMGIYVNEGVHEERVLLREVFTHRIYRAFCPTGYHGSRGELWYARLLPSPLEGDGFLVFMTPYVLVHPSEQDWLDYFQRALSRAAKGNPLTAYARHMKYGPSPDYWPKFVFEAYVNYGEDFVLLKGLPDMPESLPHSTVRGYGR